MEGWIKLYRKFTDWEWYTDSAVKDLFIHLLLSANHQPKQWRGETIGVGETITSVASLAAETGLSTKSVRTALNKLEKTGEIERKATNRNSLIIVVNYSVYQSFEYDEGQTKGQSKGKPNGKQRANKGQTKGKPTNNNDKNDKNDKNERIIQAWNSIPDVPKIQKISGSRETHLKARLDEYGIDVFIETIGKVKDSEFLRGKNSNGWVATFDWFVKSSNFQKVCEENYANRKPQKKDDGIVCNYDIDRIAHDTMYNDDYDI